MRIKIGIIGCGYWGEKLIRNFIQSGKVDLEYCCDLNEEILEKIKRSYPSTNTTKNYEDVLNSDVDAVVIAIPLALHYKIAKEMLLNNKHVLVEKPMVSGSKEALELIELAKKNNKILMVDHTFEYSPAIIKMKEITHSDSLGQIFYIRSNWLNLGLLQPDVNVIWDLCTHIFSIINYILDEQPTSISVNARGFVRNHIEEAATITLKFKDKKMVNINVSWLEPRKVREFVIVGSKKMMVFDLINLPEQIKIYEGGVDLVAYDPNTLGFNYRSGDVHSPNLKNIEPLFDMCNTFISCIRNEDKPRSDGRSGLRVIKLLEAADESLRNGGKEILIKNDY